VDAPIDPVAPSASAVRFE